MGEYKGVKVAGKYVSVLNIKDGVQLITSNGGKVFCKEYHYDKGDTLSRKMYKKRKYIKEFVKQVKGEE